VTNVNLGKLLPQNGVFFPLNAIGEETITQNTTPLMQETAIG
jgi:hypothetical protein